MNVGIDAKRIFFNNSGLGNYSRRFYLALANGFPGDSFLLYSPKSVPPGNPYLNEVLKDNSQIRYPESFWHKWFNGSPWRSALVTGQLKKDQIGIYYGLSNEIPFGIRNSSIIKVVVIHDLIFLRYPELYPAIDVEFYKIKTAYACKYADHIIANSSQTKEDIMNFYQVPESKITIIFPSGHPLFYAEKCADPSEFFTAKRKYIISIGAITPRKNLLRIVEAYNRVKDRYDLDLVVVGSAVGKGRDYLRSIMKFIIRNGLSGRVHFLGNLPYHYLPGLCRNAEMLVYPSQFEGFGMPIVEGLFSRIPVITSKGGCFPEAGGEGAIYIDPNDVDEMASQIVNLMESASLKNELIEKGLKHVARFTMERVGQDIVSFHKAACL